MLEIISAIGSFVGSVFIQIFIETIVLVPGVSIANLLIYRNKKGKNNQQGSRSYRLTSLCCGLLFWAAIGGIAYGLSK